MAATSRCIDVSSYQGAQDWKALAAGGLTAVQVKASEGEHTHDAHYRMHMDGVLSVSSLLPQAYHFAWPNQDAHAEADNYLSVVGGDADRHPAFVHWLDLERRSDGANYAGRSSAQIRAYAEAWIDRVRAAFPRQRVGCYTSAADIAAGRYPRNSDALWYPAYPAGPLTYTQAEQRTRPAPGGIKAWGWQFASKTPAGKSLDQSIAYMTPAALRAWAGGSVQEDDPMAGITLADINKAVWATDNIAAPADAPDLKTNPTWQAQSILRDIQAKVRAMAAAEAGQTAAIAKLASLIGSDVDTEEVVAAVQQAIAEAVVKVSVDVTGTDPTPAAE